MCHKLYNYVCIRMYYTSTLSVYITCLKWIPLTITSNIRISFQSIQLHMLPHKVLFQFNSPFPPPPPLLSPVAVFDEEADTPRVRSLAAATSDCTVTTATPSPSPTLNVSLVKVTVMMSSSSMKTTALLAVSERMRPMRR